MSQTTKLTVPAEDGNFANKASSQVPTLTFFELGVNTQLCCSPLHDKKKIPLLQHNLEAIYQARHRIN